MEKSVKIIGTIATMGIMIVCAYWLGTTQAETVTKIHTRTVTDVKEVEKVVEVVPDGYIALEDCIPLEDIACYFIDGYDYPCFELKDVGNQLDNPDNKSYTEIMEGLEDVTDEYSGKY